MHELKEFVWRIRHWPHRCCYCIFWMMRILPRTAFEYHWNKLRLLGEGLETLSAEWILLDERKCKGCLKRRVAGDAEDPAFAFQCKAAMACFSIQNTRPWNRAAILIHLDRKLPRASVDRRWAGLVIWRHALKSGSSLFPPHVWSLYVPRFYFPYLQHLQQIQWEGPIGSPLVEVIQSWASECWQPTSSDVSGVPRSVCCKGMPPSGLNPTLKQSVFWTLSNLSKQPSISSFRYSSNVSLPRSLKRHQSLSMPNLQIFASSFLKPSRHTTRGLWIWFVNTVLRIVPHSCVIFSRRSIARHLPSCVASDPSVKRNCAEHVGTTNREVRMLYDIAESTRRAKLEVQKLYEDEARERELHFYKDIAQRNFPITSASV